MDPPCLCAWARSLYNQKNVCKKCSYIMFSLANGLMGLMGLMAYINYAPMQIRELNFIKLKVVDPK